MLPAAYCNHISKVSFIQDYLISAIGHCYHSANVIKSLALKWSHWGAFTVLDKIIFHYPVLLLVKTRYLSALLNCDADPQIQSLETFIEVLENSPEQSVERKLAAQQPGKD